MSLSIGIVGLPNVGKSTLFNALTRSKVPAQNYPFCTIDPSVGIVPVPDERLEVLARISNTEKIIPAVIEFVDIAGLVKGASEGAGLGNQFLSHIRETDAILEVVRIFDDTDTIHVDGTVDPVRDIEVINMELILADMSTLEKRVSNLQKDVKRGDKDATKKSEVLSRVYGSLKEEVLVSSQSLTDDDKLEIKDCHLITAKPFLYALNKKSGGKNLDETNDLRFANLMSYLKAKKYSYVIIDAKVESDLSDFDGEERSMMASELGVNDDGISTLIKESYKLLGLSSYLTTGVKETRAWTFKTGSLAPVASASIHSDFEKKFIRAEVVAYEDLKNLGSMQAVKDAGKLQVVGKDYVMKEGDVVEFLIG